MDSEIFDFVLTAAGNRAVWEQGGATTSNGKALVVTGSQGQKLKSVLINNACNQKHALIKVREKDHIIVVDRKHDILSIDIYQITSFNDDTLELEAIRIYQYLNGEWDQLPPFKRAINAAVLKSRTYHCRKPAYCFLPNNLF